MNDHDVNLEIRRQALAVYLRFCEAVYTADVADFKAAREILAERKKYTGDADAMYALEGDIAVWASENAAIRSEIMTDFAEGALALAQDHETTVYPPEIVRVRDMDDRELRQYIAAEVERIKAERRKIGLQK